MIELSRYYGDKNGEYSDRYAVIGVDDEDGVNYTIKLYASEALIETRVISGHTIDYVEDCAENWVTGVIK